VNPHNVWAAIAAMTEAQQAHDVPRAQNLLEVYEQPNLEAFATEDSEAVSQLPSLKELLSGSADSIEKVTAGLGELQQRLAEEKKAHMQELSKQREQYDKDLAAMEMTNKAAAEDEAALGGEVSGLRDTNQQLHKQARELQEANQMLREDIQKLIANMTNAREYAHEALSKSDDSQAPELDVLAELSKKDSEAQAQLLAKNRFAEIMAPQSLLAIASKKRGVVEDSFQALSGAVGSYSQSRLSSEEPLKAAFENDMAAAHAVQAKHAETLKDLSVEKGNMQKMEAQLSTAVEHLQNTNRLLQGKKASLKAFLGRMSA